MAFEAEITSLRKTSLVFKLYPSQLSCCILEITLNEFLMISYSIDNTEKLKILLFLLILACFSTVLHFCLISNPSTILILLKFYLRKIRF